LDHLVGRVFEIRDGRLHEYIGNYSYFIHKRDAEKAAAAPLGLAATGRADTAGEDPGTAVPGVNKPGKSRDLRRHEAEERNQRGKIKKEISRELHKLEAEIMELESIKIRNQALLCDPEVLQESARIKPLMQELKVADRRLAELLRRWEEMMRQHEELERPEA
jgi:ATP-binding cassette subfamily F protein 3